MKVISYSLFGADRFDENNRFVFMAYLRGLYFNLRMNKLVYPGWETLVEVDRTTYNSYSSYFLALESLGLLFGRIQDSAPLCNSMLWRMQACFYRDVACVLCRDTDAITTYREAQAVNSWRRTSKDIHAILDNPAHSGLMGGMVGFDAFFIRNRFNSWDDIIRDTDLKKHGSDQNLLNKIFAKDQDKIFWSINPPASDYRIKYAESDLTCRHIGSAGVVEMELLRFFQRHDNDGKWNEFEREFSEIMYWRR